MTRGISQNNGHATQGRKEKKSKKCGCFPRKRNTDEDSSLLNVRLIPDVHQIQQQQQQQQQQLMEQYQRQQLELQRQQQIIQQQRQFAIEDEKKPLLEDMESNQRILLDAEGGDVRGAHQQAVAMTTSIDSDYSELGPDQQTCPLLPSTPSRAPMLSEQEDDEQMKQNNKGCLASRPPLIGLTIFLYAVAYRTSIPVREQYVYGYFAASHTPFTDDFIMGNKDRSLTCKINETIVTEQLHSRMQIDTIWTLTIMNVLRCFPAILTTLVICALTDRMGRRCGMLLPLLAGFVTTITQAQFIARQLPIQFLYITSLVEGISGGYMTFQSCAFAYFGEVLRKNRSSKQFTICLAIIYLSGAIGNYISGFLIDWYGYANAMYAISAIYLASLVQLCLCLPEKGACFFTSPWKTNLPPFNLLSVFTRSYRVFCVYFKRNKNSKSDSGVHYKLRLLLLIFMVESVVSLGRSNVDTMYMIGVPFCMNSLDLGLYQAMNYICRMVAAFVITPAASLLMPSSFVCFLACISGLIGNIMLTLSESTALLWASMFIAIGTSAIVPLAEVMMSVLLNPKHHGILFASIGIAEVLCDAASGVLLNIIYMQTVSWYTGVTFIAIGGFYATGLLSILLLWIV